MSDLARARRRREARMADEAQPQGVQPQPTPVGWTMGRVPAATTNGEPVIAVRFDLVTGTTVIFLPASAARRMADQLREHATGIHVASDLPPETP